MNKSIQNIINMNKNAQNIVNKYIQNIVENNPPITNNMEKNQIYGILYYLDEILKNNLEGDIVELGCNVGTTSIFIKYYLNLSESDKIYHVYDSWEGLPEKMEYDICPTNDYFIKGRCKTSKETFIKVFNHYKLELPIIHSGWFKEIPDNEYPDKICFAFLDGDFYSSIIDSLNKIYHKMVKGGIIIIDDCGWDVLPGCKKAVDDFLIDKAEKLELTGYPDNNYIFGSMYCGGKITKL